MGKRWAGYAATATHCVCLCRWFGTGAKRLADPREPGAAEILPRSHHHMEEAVPIAAYILPSLSDRPVPQTQWTSRTSRKYLNTIITSLSMLISVSFRTLNYIVVRKVPRRRGQPRADYALSSCIVFLWRIAKINDDITLLLSRLIGASSSA